MSGISVQLQWQLGAAALAPTLARGEGAVEAPATPLAPLATADHHNRSHALYKALQRALRSEAWI
ncbi:MAG: hypothetical protein L0Y66_25490 [Myxococcaceae bacterium]|nr:hypothetical protein [Myxococcaceae bacterium]